MQKRFRGLEEGRRDLMEELFEIFLTGQVKLRVESLSQNHV